MPETVSNWIPEKMNITMTERAINHLLKQIKKEGHGIGMRFGIKKSGCSGYAYDIKVIDKIEQNDKTFPLSDGLLIAVSPQHLPVLQGTEIDYIQDGINWRFQFNNPNETASCGCGESFTVGDVENE